MTGRTMQAAGAQRGRQSTGLAFACAIVCAAAAASTARATGATFLAVGDWGGIGTSKEHADAQRAVARGMSKAALQLGASLVVGVGDNAYGYGFTGTDDPRFNTTWATPYNLPGLSTLPWVQTIGNHGYGLAPEAQVQYSALNPRWVMPARYYTHDAQIGAAKVTFVVLDTSPCVKEYRSNNPAHWDPKPNRPNTPAGYAFHKNILAQKCSDQLAWLTKTLPGIPKDRWLIGVGHHRADQPNEQDLLTPLRKAGMRMYINGHMHNLEYYHENGDGHFVQTGAGSMVGIGADEEDHNHAPLEGNAAHKYSPVWTQKVAGFTAHTFSADGTKMTTRYMNYTGGVVYSFVAAQQ